MAESVMEVQKEKLKEVASSLKARGFNILMDLTAVDYLDWEEKDFRFEVIYNLYALSTHERIILKVPVHEKDLTVDSVVSLWAAADWYEREVWDMFGIKFAGHPNLKRILMYESFKGHALRKDYPYSLRQPQIGPQN